MGLTMSKNSTRGRTLILETANTQARAQLFATYPDGFTQIEPLIGLFDFKAVSVKNLRHRPKTWPSQVLGALLANYMVCRQAVSLLPGRFALLESVKLHGGAELCMDSNKLLCEFSMMQLHPVRLSETALSRSGRLVAALRGQQLTARPTLSQRTHFLDGCIAVWPP